MLLKSFDAGGKKEKKIYKRTLYTYRRNVEDFVNLIP